jgi:hypothetical protein
MVDTLLSSSIVVASGDIDAEETLSVGPFLFFFGKIGLITFDCFRFRAPVMFVYSLFDPTVLCDAGMLQKVGLLFLFLSGIHSFRTPKLYSFVYFLALVYR